MRFEEKYQGAFMPLPDDIASKFPSAVVPTAPRITPHTVKPPSLVIVEDTREQNPLTLELSSLQGLPPFEVVRGTLPTGDYSVRGLESSLCYERKSVEDLVNTLNPKTCNYEPNWGKPWRRFNREIARMSYYGRALILCEGKRLDIVHHNYTSQIEPQSILGMIDAIELDHGVRTVFCGSRMAMASFIVKDAANYFHLRFKKYFRPEDNNRTKELS